MRRKPRGRGREKFSLARPGVLPVKASESSTTMSEGRRYARRLSPEEVAWIHECIARCRFLDLPVRSTLAAEWEATWGTKFRESLYTHYCFGREQADARRAALQEVMDDPSLRQYAQPARLMKLMKGWTDECLEPVVIGHESVQVLRDGKWQHDVLPVRRREAVAAARFAELQVRLVERLLDATAPSVSRHGSPPAKSASGMWEANDMEVDPASKVSPELRALLISQEGMPFGTPGDVRVTLEEHEKRKAQSYERHLAEMVKWDTEGVAPSWTEGSALPDNGAPAPRVAERLSAADLGAAVLEKQGDA